jgi:hypothetical protein
MNIKFAMTTFDDEYDSCKSTLNFGLLSGYKTYPDLDFPSTVLTGIE